MWIALPALFLALPLCQVETQAWTPIQGKVSYSDIHDLVPPLAKIGMSGITIEFEATIFKQRFCNIKVTKVPDFADAPKWLPKIIEKILLTEPDSSKTRLYRYTFGGKIEHNLYVQQ